MSHHLNLEPSLVFWPILANFPKNQLSQIRSFMVINEKENPLDAVVVTDDNKVFGFFRDASKVTKIVELGGGGDGKQIVQMCHGQKHVMALTNEGQVLQWKEDFNLNKQLIEDENISLLFKLFIKDENEIESLLPKVIDFGTDTEPIAMIRCGLGHNLAVTERTGKVYAWGNDNCGAVIPGSGMLIPTKVFKLDQLVVVKVECGDNHSMALAENGLVYSWGLNKFGQLGIGNSKNQLFPVNVTINTGDDYPKDIACGSNHSLLLTEQGTVYGCGRNDLGQLGNGSNQSVYSKFAQVNCNGVRFGSIYAFDNFSIAISKSGFCYIWGQSKSSHLTSPYNTSLLSLDHVLGVHCPYTRISRLIQISSPISPLVSTLGKSFNDPTSSDLKFVLDGRSIHVHRLLLQISSPYYQRMLSDDWLKSDSVEIDNYSYSVYYARLRYIYTGHFPNMDNLDEAIELFDLANYQLDYGLRDLCINHLTETVSLDNCCRLFNLAIDYNLDSMRQNIGKFIAANLNNVVKSDSFELLTDKQCRKVMLSLKHFMK